MLLRLAASVLLSLVAVEVAARLAGLRPKDELAANPNEPILHAPDPLLGWKTVPGSYVIPPYAPEGAPARVTIWPDGSRATADVPRTSGSELLLVGCSFAFGWPISDQETMAWRLQAGHPELRIVNHAVKAYGTLQALMLLEQLFAAGERPTRVVYGFHQSHEDRNVAAPRWLAMLERFSRTGGITLPYASLRPDGSIERHPPERYPTLPLRGTLASVAYVEDLLVRPAKLRVLGKRRVTEQLILAMRDLCVRHGVRFDVVLLQASAEARSAYGRFFAREKIAYADCVVPIPPELRVPGEGHPGPVIHESWTACVENRLLRTGA
ncbi:hypothetical protein K2Z84_00560 [Candidatus Binatia bacterium]|nr:hypothetical protein [Candidatus Binatia bacterium]